MTAESRERVRLVLDGLARLRVEREALLERESVCSGCGCLLDCRTPDCKACWGRFRGPRPSRRVGPSYDHQAHLARRNARLRQRRLEARA